ncbi:MAG: hypothetical protein ACFFFB_21220 [Candidatus Heimdallarchaeota archaeon]
MDLNKSSRRKKVIFTLISVIILLSSITILNLNPIKPDGELNIKGNLQISGVTHFNKQWLKNSNFSTLLDWNSTIQGDSSDVLATIAQNQANYLVIGDSAITQIDEPLNDTDWIAMNNPEFPILPDGYGINSSGCYFNHVWNEGVDQTRNTPSVHWSKNITLPVNMSDYIITSASLSAVFNASVQALDHDGGGVEAPGDYTEGQNPPADTQFGIGDSARFYVLISDREKINSFEVASNQTVNLGQDSPVIENHTDTFMNVIPEDVLKSYLMTVLELDNFNFTITLGIDVYCEDNEYNVDIDRWKALIIKSFNLTFTYKKRIDQFTTVSFDQTGNQITGDDVQIIDAILGFEFATNQSWPTDLSPNSEIRVYVNNKQYNETIKLERSLTTFQEAFEGGIDVTSLILKDVNISVSFEFFLADEFGLDEDIRISIDNTYLDIHYIEVLPDVFPEPIIFRILLVIATVIGIILGGYLIAYQRILKYPKPVRKVRKYQRTLRRKEGPKTYITSSKRAFSKLYAAELGKTSSLLKGKPIAQESPSTKTISKEPVSNPSGSDLKENIT